MPRARSTLNPRPLREVTGKLGRETPGPPPLQHHYSLGPRGREPWREGRGLGREEKTAYTLRDTQLAFLPRELSAEQVPGLSRDLYNTPQEECFQAHPEPSSLLPPHTIPLDRPSAPAPSIQYRASNLDWRLVSYMILYIFQCHSPKSSHPLPLSQLNQGRCCSSLPSPRGHDNS